MRKVYGLVVITLTFALGNLRAEEPTKRATSLAGSWAGEKGTKGGKDKPVPEGGITFTFMEDGKWLIKMGAKESMEWGTYKIDSKKNPAEIDLALSQEKKGLISGIYKIEGDTLTLCISDEPGSARPTKFESPEGSKIMLMILKRVKK